MSKISYKGLFKSNDFHIIYGKFGNTIAHNIGQIVREKQIEGWFWVELEDVASDSTGIIIYKHI